MSCVVVFDYTCDICGKQTKERIAGQTPELDMPRMSTVPDNGWAWVLGKTICNEHSVYATRTAPGSSVADVLKQGFPESAYKRLEVPETGDRPCS